MLPPIISALGMQVFWLSTGHVGRIENVIIAHAIFFSTLPLVTISLAMETMDQALPEAAQTLGADQRTTFRTITLPLLIPSMITGYAAAFVLSLNEYIISFLVAGFTVETLAGEDRERAPLRVHADDRGGRGRVHPDRRDHVHPVRDLREPA